MNVIVYVDVYRGWTITMKMRERTRDGKSTGKMVKLYPSFNECKLTVLHFKLAIK